MNTQEQNERMLGLLARYLTDSPRGISLSEVECLARETGESPEYAFSALLAERVGLDVAENREDLGLFIRYFLPMVKLLDPREEKRDPFFDVLPRLPIRVGDWEMREMEYAACEAFPAGDMRQLPDGRVLPAIGFFMEPFSYPAVLERGRIWMTVTPNERVTMQRAIEEARGRVLTYGVGMGYFACRAAGKPEVGSVTVVEREMDAIRLFESSVLPRAPGREKIRVICDDALAYAASLAGGEFDFVFADIWHDVSDGLPLWRELRRMERPGTAYRYWIEETMRCY